MVATYTKTSGGFIGPIYIPVQSIDLTGVTLDDIPDGDDYVRVPPDIVGDFKSLNGMSMGGILRGDIILNQLSGNPNVGEIQLEPSTGNKFVHPNGIEWEFDHGSATYTNFEDTITGTGFLAWVGDDNSRFSLLTLGSNDLVVIRYEEKTSQWEYNTNSPTWGSFTPIDNDCIVAKIVKTSSGIGSGIDYLYQYALRSVETESGAQIRVEDEITGRGLSDTGDFTGTVDGRDAVDISGTIDVGGGIKVGVNLGDKLEISGDGEIVTKIGSDVVINSGGEIQTNIKSSDGLYVLIDTTNKLIKNEDGNTLFDLNPIAAGGSQMLDDLFVGSAITGGVIQTSYSGQQIKLDSSDNTFKLYADLQQTGSGTEVVRIDDNIFTSGVPGIHVNTAGAIALGDLAGTLAGLSFGETSKFNVGNDVIRSGAAWKIPDATKRPILIQMNCEDSDANAGIKWHISDVAGAIDANDIRMTLTKDNFDVDVTTQVQLFPNVKMNADLNQYHILYPRLAVVDTDNSDVTITVDVRRFDDGFSTEITFSQRGFVVWWISASENGDPVNMTGSQTFAVNNGNDISPASATDGIALNHSITDNTGKYELNITNTHNATPVTYYFHAVVQGVVYNDSFTVNTTGAA